MSAIGRIVHLYRMSDFVKSKKSKRSRTAGDCAPVPCSMLYVFPSADVAASSPASKRSREDEGVSRRSGAADFLSSLDETAEREQGGLKCGCLPVLLHTQCLYGSL